jgi:hypothetical protein
MNSALVIGFTVGAIGLAAGSIMTLAFWHNMYVDETHLEPRHHLANKLMVAGSVLGIAFGILRVIFFVS